MSTTNQDCMAWMRHARKLEAENERLTELAMRQRKALESALEDFYAIEPHIPHVTEDLREKAIRDIKAALGGEG